MLKKPETCAVGVLPTRFYGDPAECVDELRRIAERLAEQERRRRLHKGRRIRALVREVMRNGGGR